MKFPKFFRRSGSRESTTNIPFSTLVRWALYDLSIDEPNQIAVAMGLSPISEEGTEMELADSAIRLENIYDILPFIDVVSDYIAKMHTAVQLRSLEEEVPLEELEMTPEMIEVLVATSKTVAFSALIAALSSGIELGIIHTDVDHIHSWKEDNEQ